MRRPCCDKEGTNKGAWSKQEDEKLVDYIKNHGEGCWHSLPKAAGPQLLIDDDYGERFIDPQGLDRCGKSCRLRWINYLRPDIKRGNFAQDEEDLIIKLHALLGNRWSLIAGRLPGRTDNEVKNYWNSHIRKKLIGLGIDPNNHKLQDLSCQPTLLQAPLCPIKNSSDSKKETHSKKPSKCRGNPKKGESKNTRVRYVEKETSPMLDLNLDLTIALPLNN